MNPHPFQNYLLCICVMLMCFMSRADAQDSITVRLHPSYGHATGLHRWILGENYRREWSMEIKLPVLHLSTFNGGLTPERLGGGMQSKSLRLREADGREWVIRTVEKIPDLVVPEKLRQTFAKDLVDDATSAQHPFAALLVPPVADAAGVPHTNPVVGYIAPDSALGSYASIFSGKAVVLEERAPYKTSDNTLEVLDKLKANNANSYDAVTFLKARMIDVLFADWDRHEDQWRWYAVDNGKGKGKTWIPIPRDRDQVVSVTEGALPHLVKGLYTMPRVAGFTEKLRKPRHYFFKSAFLNAHPASHISHERWTAIVSEFVQTISDPVLEASLSRLPPPVYLLRHDAFLHALQSRRSQLAAAMEDYYQFIHRIVDIRLSDQDEVITLYGATLTIRNAAGDTLLAKTFDQHLTKELRIYTEAGNDSIAVARPAIPMRVITGRGYKSIAADARTDVYGRTDNIQVSGGARTHLSNDSANSAYSPVNRYNLTFPLVNAGVNADDGFLFGAGFRHVRQQGFRKYPYSSMYQLMLTHAFSSDAFKLFFRSEWIHVFGTTDITLQANVNAPNNTVNFFGVGNESGYNQKAGLRYYRTRFNTEDLYPALRWRARQWSISVGPALQYYDFEKGDNVGRFINEQSLIGSYDSATVDQSKLHLGGKLSFLYDTRNSQLLPTSGVHIEVELKAYKSTNRAARDLGQLSPELSWYAALNGSRTLVIGNRTGGTLSLGNPAFYQSAFLGGQGNLLGFRQYRWAGRHAAYDNLECRLKLADVSSYILPGELGLTGFFDIGRVWSYRDASDTWHHGEGGGIYYVPAQLTIFRLMAGHSLEGWYPYISMGIRL